jgi:hypothetical protein
MAKLINPTFNLFLYYLKDGVNTLSGDRPQTYKSFLQTAIQTSVKSLKPTVSQQELETDLKRFLKSVYLGELSSFEFSGYLGETYSVSGSYNYFPIDDSEGLLFKVAIQGKFEGAELADCLEKIHDIEPDDRAVAGKLGQTWTISGWVENASKEELERLAAQAYKNLLDRGWQYQETGQFLGGTVFEFWRSSPEIWENIEQSSHAIVVFYPNAKAVETAAEFSESWKSLFCHRNKILSAYAESRELKQKMLREFNRMSPSIEQIYNLELAELKAALKKNVAVLSDFVENIHSLERQQNAIEVSLHNYEKYANYIQGKAERGFQVSNDFKFLQGFGDMVKLKYQRQIEKDYASVRPCLDILENLIMTIRGIVEIEQAERDRAFQNFVGIAGFGFGTAIVVAASSPSWIDGFADATPIAPSASSLLLVLSLSVLGGGIGAAFGWMAISTFRPKRLPSGGDRP